MLQISRSKMNSCIQAGILAGLFLLLGITGTAYAQCPEKATFKVIHEQSLSGNDGEIQVTFTEGAANINSSQYQVRLWDGDINAFVHNSSGVDPGFFENKSISKIFMAPNVFTFKNLPPSKRYIVVITSKSCTQQYGEQDGVITLKSYKQ